MFSNVPRVVGLILSVLCFLAIVSDAIAKVELRTVAMRGQVPAELENDNYFFNFYEPTINIKGQVAFEAYMLEPTVGGALTRYSVWYADGNGRLELVALDGMQAPEAPQGTRYASFHGVKLNAGGDLVYGGTVTDAGDNFVALKEVGGVKRLLAYRGSPVLDSLNGALFEHISTPDFFLTEGTQTLAITTTTANPGAVEYRFFESSGQSTMLNFAALSDLASDESLPIAPGLKAASPNGQSLFQVRLEGPNVNENDDHGLWVVDAYSQSRLVAREGRPAPGMPSTSVFDKSAFTDSNFRPNLNNDGKVAFSAKVTGPEVNDSNNQGIWSEDRGNGLELIARTGEPAPDMEPGVVFRSFSNVPIAINGSGQVAFGGIVSGPGIGFDNGGIWSEGMGSGLELVHRDGAPAPGVNGGVNISTFSFNALGQVMFLGFFGTSTANHGIWAQDLDGNLHLIARTGQLIDVDNGPGTDMRTIIDIASFYTSGNQDGRASSFNDRGQVVFKASFTDGSEGIFVSNAVAVPEPSMTLIMIAPVALLTTMRRAFLQRGKI